MNLDINTSKLHAHVLPLFWPMLWLNLYLLRRWYDQHGESIGGISYVATRYGVIRIERIFPKTDDNLTIIRRFENTTDSWCFDQLGTLATMFARLCAVKPCELGEWLAAALNLSGFTPAPAINDSS